jgi:hypothetical protein
MVEDVFVTTWLGKICLQPLVWEVMIRKEGDERDLVVM